MKLTDKFVFDADQEAVWNVFMSPEAIAKALPGVDKLDPVEGEASAWRAVAKINIASVTGSYAGTIRMTDVQPRDRFTLVVAGEGQQSIINGTAVLSLTYDPGQGKTLLTWEAEAKLSGKLASIGQRLISGAASLLSRQFFQGLAKQLHSDAAN